MKKLSLVLAVVMVFMLCACGASKTDKDLLGTYTLYAVDYDENTTLFADELFSGENYITLKSSSLAEMCVTDEVMTVKWKTDDEKLTLIAADGEMEGTIEDGILSLVINDTKMYFVAEGASTDSIHAITLDDMLNGLLDDSLEEAMSESGDDSSEETEIQQMWNGWWYGGIEFWNCDGDYEYLNDQTPSVTMFVDLDSSNAGTFKIYEPYGYVSEGYDENCIAEVECYADENYLHAVSGTCFGNDIYVNDWVFVHNSDDEDLIQMGSEFKDSTGRLKFDFSLMPWGNTWETEPKYQEWILDFEDYIAAIEAGQTDPYGNYSEAPAEPVVSETPTAQNDTPSTSEKSALLGSNPTKLNINDRDIVYVYYPGDQFEYNADYGKIKSTSNGTGILFDPMLGATNLAELKASYEANNSSEDDYSLSEITVNGYKAIELKYSDWLGATMRVDVDFGGSHDGYYGMSFCVSGDSLSDCDTDLIWAIIESFELAK